jgi:hypothetical protein
MLVYIAIFAPKRRIDNVVSQTKRINKRDGLLSNFSAQQIDLLGRLTESNGTGGV